MHSAPAAEMPAHVSSADLLFGDFAGEHLATRRTLERYPEGKGDWRPHDRSRTLAELASHVADLVNRGTLVLETEGLDVASRAPQPTMDSAPELLAHFDAGLRRLNAALATADIDRLNGDWAMRRGGQVLMVQPRRVLLRLMMMSHLVHHRAQLGVYYRLLGVAVPGAYGPSADD